jgi:hypothetical protein
MKDIVSFGYINFWFIAYVMMVAFLAHRLDDSNVPPVREWPRWFFDLVLAILITAWPVTIPIGLIWSRLER